MKKDDTRYIEVQRKISYVLVGVAFYSIWSINAELQNYKCSGTKNVRPQA